VDEAPDAAATGGATDPSAQAEAEYRRVSAQVTALERRVNELESQADRRGRLFRTLAYGLSQWAVGLTGMGCVGTAVFGYMTWTGIAVLAAGMVLLAAAVVMEILKPEDLDAEQLCKIR